MPQTKSESKTILHTERNELRDAVRQELKTLGVKEVIAPANGDDCIGVIVQNPNTPLILDWEIGAAEVVRILAASRGHYKIDTRPTLLVASEVSDRVLHAAWEYGVLNVHTGQISRQIIKESLATLLEADAETRDISNILSSVAEARRRDEWPVATPLLSNLSAKYPNNALLHCELAENLIHEERWAEAAALLEPHARGERPHVRAQHLLARCLLKSGQPHAAAGLLQSARLLNPFNIDRLVELGEVLLSQAQIAEASKAFEDAKSLAPKRTEATVGVAKCRLMQGEISEALSLLKNVSGPRELAAIFNTTAILSMQHGNYDKGMALYQSALNAVGANKLLQSRLYFNMGMGYRRQSRFDEAADSFQKALAIDPAFAKAKKHLDLAISKAPFASSATDARKTGRTIEINEESLDARPRPAGDKLPMPEIAPFSLDEDDF